MNPLTYALRCTETSLALGIYRVGLACNWTTAKDVDHNTDRPVAYHQYWIQSSITNLTKS